MSRILYALHANDPARHFSPHVWKTIMSLSHKGLDHELVPVCFTEIPKIEGNTAKIVPLLRDGDHLVADSFTIAEYLEDTYPDHPSLFGGEGGRAMARFVESWSQSMIHTALMPVVLLDIFGRLQPEDQAYFRASREPRLGRTLEEAGAEPERHLLEARKRLEPMRVLLKRQPFIGGQAPLFSDYILFGALQWARIVSPHKVVETDDPVALWFERCLDLHGGIGRSVTAA